MFLTKEGLIKLGDFGISKVLSATRVEANTVVGTAHYISPEIVSIIIIHFNSFHFIVIIYVFMIVLGNISIFWKYRDISFDNISYRGNFLISKYRISILIILNFIIFMYATHEVCILDMSTSVI